MDLSAFQNQKKIPITFMASNALSNVKKIYSDKFPFQNIHFAGSKGFWGIFQKFLAGARFPIKTNI